MEEWFVNNEFILNSTLFPFLTTKPQNTLLKNCVEYSACERDQGGSDFADNDHFAHWNLHTRINQLGDHLPQ